ncbi:MAG: hypothetical protein US83_C0010G0044 [Candidatus Falkowbacteria bacterium GW2011_GWC2_38_22]|uniref:Uncharacterized protein n=1 Tax=Candidatus Falkowbacteria bacterium GW2011_GWE1_38_31 TaxID=1618638 RepID=A0A0G0K467_9BACT|nr:MAG: hypothetical protein US73_C0005G0044 [Candidatus Falkowbacteria bacterium GW2011_GWF2_38_1205]KKQ61010.1 MAG: hypothetical protein US83_C0010G0044 [Candidatus Falkowbacteria bacterium GW2011_GWC2_38_22]KKQ63461.1 MAG: hypothetical protein US84_C0006G0064 [Candidatus Falkowbacteria bacterium GW2011_GWF1_38_22]KKQ65468.1 MAG: hypothetical protein US87_C0007G0044 [Candidatus Falkowbacteria bacterium GW2011_GWE2_38_254]KKQ70225.1 MAG: hypothetical protein US91_C0006G0064 [Candidatus Falkowb
MKTKIKNIFVLMCLVVVLILPYFVFAQSPLDKLSDVGVKGGYSGVTSENDLVTNAGKIVSIFFSILGIIFVVLMLYAGYNYMIAAGDQSKVDKALSTIRRAIIGLIITVGSYAISNFVLFKLLN